MTLHETYIWRCLQIAKNGLGTTRPNPMVGCVIVHDTIIIGEGFTSPYGESHAEVNAINSVKDKSLLKNSTLYVTLEPCSHFGKTPPCSDLIIKYKIPRVVIGCVDDNPEVAGQGIQRLKDAGCEVTVGVSESLCKHHHKRFFTFHNRKRPYIILKWAETQDGYIAPQSKLKKQPVWITNPTSRQLVHKWRTEEHAILVGTNTVLEDNPNLTARDWVGHNPIRVVLDKNNTLSKDLNVFNNDAETIVLKAYTAKSICDVLYKQHITSVIVEGGAKTLQIFIDADIWDEARVFKGQPNFIKGTKAPAISGRLESIQQFSEDQLIVSTND